MEEELINTKNTILVTTETISITAMWVDEDDWILRDGDWRDVGNYRDGEVWIDN